MNNIYIIVIAWSLDVIILILNNAWDTNKDLMKILRWRHPENETIFRNPGVLSFFTTGYKNASQLEGEATEHVIVVLLLYACLIISWSWWSTKPVARSPHHQKLLLSNNEEVDYDADETN